MNTGLKGLLAALVLVAGSAHAEEGVVKIRLGRLDLSNEADVRVAHDRIRAAVRDYCAPPSSYPIGGHMERCKQDITGKAMAQLADRQAVLKARLAAR